MYAIKNETEDQLFMERARLIRRIKPQDIMIYLGINKKFILGITDSATGEQHNASSIRPSYSQDHSHMLLTEQALHFTGKDAE
jgi:hypothetical protein